MRYFHWRKALDFRPTINIDRVWTLVGEQHKAIAQAAVGKPGAEVPIIDVTKAGFHKVLGKGSIPKLPFVLRAKLFSKKAEKKIQAAGGVCELTA